MSQSTDNKPQLLIDLTNARQATALNADSILHRVQLEAFLNRVEDVVERVSGFRNKLGEYGHKRSVSYERYHDVITLHGKRGSGKTTFLLSALKLLQEVDVRKENFKHKDWKHLDRLCVLEILDPTLFGLHEHLLLSLLAKIAFEVRSAFKSRQISSCDFHQAECNLESWEKKLQKFAKSLKHMGETRDDLEGSTPKETVPWEDAEFIFEKNMDNAQSSFGLERGFHNFLNESLNLLGKDAFVLALDDIDTRPQIGWHVLEVLRRYFTSPQLVVVLSGDMDLFKTIIEKQQLKIFDLNFASNVEVRKEFKARVDGLTEQYLLKILRTPSRISLGSFAMALQQWRRMFPDAARSVGVSKNNKMSIADLLKFTFFPMLGCHRGAEQRLFEQTLFANPARTVTQVLDVLWRVWGLKNYFEADASRNSNFGFAWPDPEMFEPVVARLREVFLVSLQNVGIERPFDLAEALQSSHGISQLMKQLFVRGYVTIGLDLLPTRQNADENNALLALNAELVLGMRANPSVLFSYIFKACFLREVLLRRDTEIALTQYEKIEMYLGLDVEVQPTVTAARFSALQRGQQAGNPLRSMGMVRLYGSSITRNSRVALKAMYGMERAQLENAKLEEIPLELQDFWRCEENSSVKKGQPFGRWVNTPTTLQDSIYSWHANLVPLGVIDVPVRDGYDRTFSIFPLLASMCDFLENDPDVWPGILLQYSQIQTVNAFATDARNMSPESGIDGEDDIDVENEKPFFGVGSRVFLDEVKSWVGTCRGMVSRVASPVALSHRIMNRFFHSLSRIDKELTEQSTFVGTYVHRCIIAFLNSVLVEEFLVSGANSTDRSVLNDNPIMNDDIFLKNIFSSKAFVRRELEASHAVLERLFTAEYKGRIVENGFLSADYPLFISVFTFPLWGMYLKPEEDLEGDTAKTVYGIYMRSQNNGKETAKATNRVVYKGDPQSSIFINFYSLLNSLAIPKQFNASRAIQEKDSIVSNVHSTDISEFMKVGDSIFGSKKPSELQITSNNKNNETRTELGQDLQLPLNPKSIKYRRVIHHESIRMVKSGLANPFPQNILQYTDIVRSLYADEAVVKKLCTVELARSFWAFAKRSLKP